MTIKTIKWDGHQITKPGIYAGIALSTYHRSDICDGPSISSSGLRTIFHQSPAHFFENWHGNPKRSESPESRAFIVGRALHHTILGEKFFAKLFAVEPSEWPDEAGEVRPWNNNRTVCKKWHAEQRKLGRAVLTIKEAETVIGMAKSLATHPLVQHGALNGLIERSMFWKDKRTGIWLKARPDSIPTHSGDFVDLKTTDSTYWMDMMRSIAKYGYHAQGALVREGARHLMGVTDATFSLVFVEKRKPHTRRVVQLKPHDLDLGHRQNEVALDRFVECLKTGTWPGPDGDKQDAEYIEMSERDRSVIEDRIKYGIS